MKYDNVQEAQWLRLVDEHQERMEVEYKSWLDLNDNETCAKLAKHLCALANSGGGWLVLGIDDDGSHSEPHPSDLSAYNHDRLNQIVQKYLTPEFECNVRLVFSERVKRNFPVVQVPSHGSVPICSKRNGPERNGKIVGVRSGLHYVRVPGPRSVAIDNPTLWSDVIHRCVVNERQGLLSSISRLFDKPVEVSADQGLEELLERGIALWKASQLESGWPVDPVANRCAFAFRLLSSAGVSVQPLPIPELRKVVGEASRKAEYESNFGWSLFSSPDYPQRATVDVFPPDVDGLSQVAVHQNGEYLIAPEVWRLACDGRGVEVQAFHEDSRWVSSAVEGRKGAGSWSAGERFSPRIQQSRIFQFVAFVRALSSNFEDAVTVEMAVDFVGLSGRVLQDPRGYWSQSRKASVDHRRVSIESSPEALAGFGGAKAAAQLAAPVARLFDGWEITAESIESGIKENY